MVVPLGLCGLGHVVVGFFVVGFVFETHKNKTLAKPFLESLADQKRNTLFYFVFYFFIKNVTP